MKKISTIEIFGYIYLLLGLANYYRANSSILWSWGFAFFGTILLIGGGIYRRRRNKKIAEQPEPKGPTLSYSSQRKKKK